MEKKKIIAMVLSVVVIVGFTAVGVKLFADKIVKNAESSSTTAGSSSEQQPEDSKPPVSDEPTSSAVSSDSSADTSSDVSSVPSSVPSAGASSVQSSKPNTPATPPQPTTQPGFSRAPEGYFNDALFIGDSRTVGLKEYGKIPGADFFATVGLSIYRIKKDTVSIDGQTYNMEGLLAAKQYGKIYIMLGINEIGGNLNSLLKSYQSFVEELKAKQPNAIIYVEANLRVAAACTTRNNQRINEYNSLLASLADNKTVFYLDANPLFDDGTGNLGAQYTSDNIHIYAKCYPVWVSWLSENVILK